MAEVTVTRREELFASGFLENTMNTLSRLERSICSRWYLNGSERTHVRPCEPVSDIFFPWEQIFLLSSLTPLLKDIFFPLNGY
ncbi:hypothetical protein ANTPLA_LOCUS3146 [Anthophora plagiata]